MAVAEHAPAQRTKDAVSERTHPLAVRPFVGNRTDGAVRLDPVKRRIGIRCYVAHGMSRNLVSCFCLRNLTSLATPRRASLSRGSRSWRRSRRLPYSRPWPALDRDHRATREKARCSRQGAPARISWALLLKHVFDVDVEQCPNCGGALKIITAPSTHSGQT